jgi:hypothetical protein
MKFPRGQIRRAVHGHATTLMLIRSLVLSKPVETASLMINRQPASMGVEDVSGCVEPCGSGDNPDCICMSIGTRETGKSVPYP